jgi:hypothetical protein
MNYLLAAVLVEAPVSVIIITLLVAVAGKLLP